MQRLLLFFSKLLLFTLPACSQSNLANRQGHCRDAAFDREVARWLNFSVPAIDVDSLRAAPAGLLLLDAREATEFEVSHLPGARLIGYDHFNAALLDSIPKDRPVVVYCSIGYRSEKIAQKIRRMGFERVSNLYGSIFEWVNRGYPLVDKNEKPTRKLHTYNRAWGKWVSEGRCEKVD